MPWRVQISLGSWRNAALCLCCVPTGFREKERNCRGKDFLVKVQPVFVRRLKPKVGCCSRSKGVF